MGTVESFPVSLPGVLKLEQVQGRYVLIENAASWIAHGAFDRVILNWPYTLASIFEVSDELGEDSARNEGRFWMAFEMLSKAIGRGQITAYGRYYEPEEGEEANPRIDVLADGRTRKIKPEEARGMIHYLGGEDDCLAIGSHIYDMVAVNWHELIAVFAPLTQDYGTHYLNEHRPQKPLLQQSSETDEILARKGRPPKWNWEQINLEIILLANRPDGLPETQALLETWVAQKCIELFGDEPGISTIRLKIGPIYRRLRDQGQKP